VTQTDSPVEAYRLETPPPEKRPFIRWLTNPFVIALAAIVVFNLVWALPRYLHFDSKLSRVPLDPRFPHQWHFPIIVAHVLTANLALLLVFFQLSSRLRRRFPVVHRTSGRVYVFAGALPTSLLALWLIPYGHQPFGELGQGAEGALWFFTTAMGFVRARQGRYVDHRRWMIYSFALALGTTWGRLIVWGMSIIPGFTMGLNWLFEVSSWLGWFVNLLVAYWWVERTAPRAQELVA
jgi:Predicted membrane protein (DUF2306)